jgi:hypothetical protein
MSLLNVAVLAESFCHVCVCPPAPPMVRLKVFSPFPIVNAPAPEAMVMLLMRRLEVLAPESMESGAV